MVEIAATMVKALREETGQGMMDCKRALQQACGDIEAAKDILRKKGLSTVVKKSGRTTGEGFIAISLGHLRLRAVVPSVGKDSMASLSW